MCQRCMCMCMCTAPYTNPNALLHTVAHMLCCENLRSSPLPGTFRQDLLPSLRHDLFPWFQGSSPFEYPISRVCAEHAFRPHSNSSLPMTLVRHPRPGKDLRWRTYPISLMLVFLMRSLARILEGYQLYWLAPFTVRYSSTAALLTKYIISLVPTLLVMSPPAPPLCVSWFGDFQYFVD